MKKLLTALVASLTLLACSASSAFEEGTHYTLIDPPQPTSTEGKIEVVEVFWYGCPHCYSLEPTVAEWLKNKPENAEFVRIPAPLNPNWEFHAKVFYTAEALGLPDEFHSAFFNEIHLNKKRMNSLSSVKRLLQDEFEVSEEAFENAWNSFAVDSKLRLAKTRVIGYGLTSVPAVIVDGKYKITAQSAGGNAAMFAVVNELVEQAN